MFLYLSKKISMPNGVKLKSIAWNSHQGWLACGGENGLLKVLKLDTLSAKGETNEKKSTMAGATSVPMNQTLEGHSGTVVGVTWNQNYRKLTSTDENGLIIVWVLFKGMWFEEMINNRNKSVVQDLRWSSDGQKICIMYEDGQVIMGNVDGHRLWTKELNVQLSLVEWSPDARLILFCTMQDTCLIYDCYGNYVSQLVICFISNGDFASIVGIDWYNGLEGHTDSNAPTLALALESGKLQLMRHELDEDPILVDMRMPTRCIKWSPYGDVFAAIGSEGLESPQNSQSMVQLYSNLGMHLRTLHVPGAQISSLSWEGRGLRLALAVDSYMYFANIRPQYHWTFFGSNTCVYGFRKRDNTEHSVMFWDISTNQRCCKYVNRLVKVTGSGERCILATMGEEPSQYMLILCNEIGNPVDSKTTSVEPLSIDMNSNYVFVASENAVYVWRYRGSSESHSSPEISSQSESTFYIDEPSLDQGDETDVGSSSDQICCICCSEKYLVVGRESGIVHRYNFPTLNLETKDLLECRPQVMELNSNSSRLAVIDMNGVLTLYDLMRAGEPALTHARVQDFERKDVWSMKWADDNADLLAIMERTRMYVLRGSDPEEPVSCTAYLCNFHNLQIQAVQLDEVMSQPEQPDKEHVVSYETKSLRDTRQMLLAVDIHDAFLYVEEHAHPRLWVSLAEHALEKLNLSIAEKAFVRCQHYYGIQFVKGLYLLREKNKQLAEICIYFKRFDAAQKIYIEMDRVDLAIDMRMKMGDWFIKRFKQREVVQADETLPTHSSGIRVEHLLYKRGAGNDLLLELTWNSIGNHFADRQNWTNAATYYGKANNVEKLAECHYALQSWPELEKLMHSLPDGSPILFGIGKMFASVGICDSAVRCFIRAGDISSAIDCSIDLNHWDKVAELSQANDEDEAVSMIVAEYSKSRLESGNPLLAVEVYEKAGQHQLAAEVLNDVAKQLAKRKQSPLEIKKLYVLAALQTEVHKGSLMGPQYDAATIFDESLENAWHGAEAYHFWLHAHRELYAGHFYQAMKAAWWLRSYADVLSVQEIYSLIALTAFYSKHYKECSLAFMKLEALKELSNSKQTAIEQLALAIFTQYNVESPDSFSNRNCPDCGAQIQGLETRCSTPTCSATFPICMASGTLIVDEDCIQCSTCKHWIMSMYSRIRCLSSCPLCHSLLTTANSSKIFKGLEYQTC